MAPAIHDLLNRQWELISVSIIMLIFSTSFTTWRIVVRSRASLWMDWSDWLMILGTACNMTRFHVEDALTVV